MAEPIRMIAWAQANQESLVRDMVRKSGFELVGIVAATSGEAAELCTALDVERIDKLRDAILHADIQLLWLAASEPIQADERHLIRQQTTPTISIEPRPGSIAHLQADPAEADTARFVPLMRHSPGYRAAQEVFEQFGPRQCVNVSFRSGPGEGSLFARLFDAIDLLEVLCGDVEMMETARRYQPSHPTQLCGGGVPTVVGEGRVNPEVIPPANDSRTRMQAEAKAERELALVREHVRRDPDELDGHSG